MKILFMISTLTNGGAERAMSNITTHLPDGVQADILVNSVSEYDYPTNANIISLGMTPRVKKNLFYQLRAFIKRIIMLKTLKKNNQYDACISFMDSANVCNILTGKKYCKTIVSVRVSVASDQTFQYRYIVSPLIRLLYDRADYVVPVSKGLEKELENVFGIKKSKIVTITNGFDVNKIHKQATEEDINEFQDKFVFITAGRYTNQKAQWHLIRAFAQIATNYDDMLLLILGQGEEKKYFEELITEYKMKDRIILIPFCKNPFPYLKASKVFVMPSMYEGYCNALCEALICELPCVATDFRTSAREILAPDTDVTYCLESGIEYAQYGVITPVCSGIKHKRNEKLESAEECLAQAMLKLYSDKEMYERYKNAARLRGKQMDINQKVQEWLQLVNDKRE